MVPSLTVGGGVPGVAGFLYRVLEASQRYEPFLVSLAMSSRDEASVRLLDPATWLRGVRVREGTWEGRSYVHIGTRLAEFEFMRYAPRRALTELLNDADIVQVVGGTPCWAGVARWVDVPVCVYAATLTSTERARRHSVETGLLAIWRRLMTRITRRLDWRGMLTCDRVFVMNRALWRKARTVCEPNRVLLAPPGVDVDRFHPGAGGGGAEGPAYILSVGRFGDPRKNAELLFRAYARLDGRRPEAPELWLAGSSAPPESAWRIAEERNVRDRIRYVGRVSHEELARLYRGARFFVLASDEEGFGLVLAEAMASGLPVVSTACGGPDDIVTDGEDGLLVPVGDAAALADAMERLVDDAVLRRSMGRLARNTAVERFSYGVTGETFLWEYAALLARNGRRPARERSAAAARPGADAGT